jgi:hypothetical protein
VGWIGFHQMLNLAEIRKQHTRYITDFEREVQIVYSTLVLPHWGGELHGFSHTLYGYMMHLFATIDLLSAYWKGKTSRQTLRMIEFMNQYICHNHEANTVAVQMWRHKLMHTSEPRYLYDERTSKTYRWLLHWGEHLPREQHYTFADTHDSRILNLALLYLIGDFRTGVEQYLADLVASLQLQSNYEKFQAEVGSYRFRPCESGR